MLQADTPDTFVLATGRTISVRDFVTLAFRSVDKNVIWEGKGEEEKGIDSETGKTVVKVNPRFYRPAEVDLLIGNPDKAKRILGWEPRTIPEVLCQMMVDADLKRVGYGFSF